MKIREVLALAPVIPVLTVSKLEHAAPLAKALYAGGLKVLEITLRTAVALKVIEAMRVAVPEAVVGAGTLLRPQNFRRVEEAGAQFAVTPGLTPQLAEAAKSVKFALLPGIASPTDILQALHFGYDTLKFFPAQQAGGIPMLQAFAGPFAEVAFCPTGGISRESAPAFLKLRNVLCVGGSWVAPNALVEQGDWAGIEALARDAARLPRHS
ncbi:MAG TPA: bifunctional 4-hydroxy-2-oxoglutarate aldolase/2-dehydro-3-deoxy-phosphogluconate aldolase [Steroidobacteraceae bacterium]|jgi:2-dehydro-3-deoxyphosphogluconate aldolase/(4S)-4-hydroxy-2-oxoglutarate aldolase|nr:bifunctional 4-hydroxy-2-oxoglutarate aldolase/2-dehydro-3-deoxy-phosphogluconate aldolase [Steroidobacteraceae bacterium]